MKKFLLSIILIWSVQFLTAQTILMNNNNPETITCGNTYNFYDAGGLNGQYSSGTAATYIKTFTPSVPSQKIRIDFFSFDVENYSMVYMQIFDGPNVSSPLIGQFNANNAPGTVVSTATGGEITVLFTHDSYVGGYQGWVAQISCVSSLTPPSNDNPCGATLLTVNNANPIYQIESLIGATNSTNGSTILDPNCSIYNNGPDVWFKAVVPASGNLAFITKDSTIYDTGIEVYNASTCSSLSYLNSINCDDDGNSNSTFGTMSKLELSQLTPGDTIFCRVWKKNGGMGLFYIAAYEPIPSVTMIYPNGGEILLQNDYIYLDFSTTLVDTVTLEFSSDNGANWSNIVNWPIANGSYIWTVPNITSTQCLIRVSQMGNPSLFDISDATFSISGPYIQVNQPNGGEIYASGQLGVDVYWNSPGMYDDVNILFSDNNGGSWTTLASNVYNYGSTQIDFPNVNSTQCLIKIESVNNPSIFDVSNATFTLTNTPPAFTIQYPLGGEVFTEGQQILISWISSNYNGNINLSFTDGDGNFTIANNIPANLNVYLWEIPLGYLLSNNWQVIIEPVGLPWFTQASNYFAVQSATPSIEITSPSLSQYFYINNYEIIQWNSSQVNLVNIEYSPDMGTNWYPIANNVSGNTYYWYVNTSVISNAIIRISDANNSSLADTSDYFLILNAIGTTIIDASYSGPTTVCAGDEISVDINELNSNIYSDNFYLLQISDANGNFTNPINIGFIYSNNSTETINANLPDTLTSSSGYLLRVLSSNYQGISDSISINIVSKPISDFTANPLVNYLPASGLINFTFSGNTSGITSYLWNFGDGGTATTQNPSYNYTTPGFYNVSLLVANAASCSTNIVKPLFITIENLFENDTIITLTSQDILGLAFVNGAKGCFALANGNCLITQDSGLTFTTVPVGLTTPLTSASLVSGLWIVTSSGGNVSLSTNGGNTWTVQNVGTTDTLFASAFLNYSNGYVVGHNGKIYKYNGSNWTQETSGTSNSLRGVAFSNTDIVTVGFNGTILRSNGNGTWNSILSPFNSHYRGVAFNDAGVGFAVGDLGRIIKSTDNGLTWSTSLSGVPAHFTSIAINGDSAWAVGNGGIIYKTFDAGNTWIRNSLDTQNDLNAITFYGEEQRRRMGIENDLRAQSSNRGYVVGDGGVARLFGNPIDTTGGNTNITELNNFNILFKVYPVPAINEITIEGTLKQEGLLNITLKDMYGATVKMINAQKENGNVIKRVSLSDLASGVYFIHIDSPEQQSIHKIVVNK